MINSKLNIFNVGIYCRLSREDDNKIGDSGSIQNQKETLTEYVDKHKWNLVNVYIDDGFTGTDFNRPGFQQLLNDIEIGLINCVVTKDLSRLGRNYIKTGQYLEEYFPEKGVRYIAVNDNYDSFEDDNDLGPFKNILNEWYARDISKKIKFSLNSMAERGERRKTAVPLYGYQQDSMGNRTLDPVSSNVVQLIFSKYIELKSIFRISKFLNEQKIYSPRYYNHVKYGFWKDVYPEGWPEDKKYVWKSSTIKDILRNREYLGDLVTKRKEVISYKIHKRRKVINPLIVKNKYPAIIDEDTFNKVNHELDIFIENAKRKENNVLHRLGVCGCCGKVLGFSYRPSAKKQKNYRFVCRNKACTNKAFITTDTINKIIHDEIKDLVDCILNNSEQFSQYVNTFLRRLNCNRNNIDIRQNETTLKRITELKRFIEGAFKAKLEGDIDEEMYKNIVAGYKSELNTLEAKRNIKQDNKFINRDSNASYFLQALENIKNLENYDTLLLSSFCKKIYVTNIRENGKLKRVIVDIDYGNLNPILKGFLGDNNE